MISVLKRVFSYRFEIIRRVKNVAALRQDTSSD